MKIAGIFSELELKIIRSRGKRATKNMKDKGKSVGRKLTKEEDDIPTIFYSHYHTFSAKKMSVSELAQVRRISMPTVSKHLKLIR